MAPHLHVHSAPLKGLTVAANNCYGFLYLNDELFFLSDPALASSCRGLLLMMKRLNIQHQKMLVQEKQGGLLKAEAQQAKHPCTNQASLG